MHSTCNFILCTAHKYIFPAFYMQFHTAAYKFIHHAFYMQFILSTAHKFILHAIYMQILYFEHHINSFLKHSICNFIFCTAHKFIPHTFQEQFHALYCTFINSLCIPHAILYFELHNNSFLEHSYMQFHTLYCI